MYKTVFRFSSLAIDSGVCIYDSLRAVIAAWLNPSWRSRVGDRMNRYVRDELYCAVRGPQGRVQR